MKKGEHYDIFPVSRSNAITKEYYNFLIGEQNRGTTKLRVCKTKSLHGYTSYHLITSP